MYDKRLFLRALSKFAAVMPARLDFEAALTELAGSVTAVLGLSGSVVMMEQDGQLRFVASASAASMELVRALEQQHAGPCRDASDTGEVVRVTDARVQSARWPEFTATANQLSVAGVAGIPMRFADETIGVLNLYAAGPREWSDVDIAVAVVLTDVATSFVVNASRLRQQQQLSQQLQEALASRVVIEQAKGITACKHAISVDQACRRMRRHARTNNASLRKVAEAIVALGLAV